MENFNLSFPIDMIKKEERIVSGIATADNIDKSNDVVDFSASLEAFKNWGGNIREMHAPIAVGKAINYEPIKVKGPDGTEYNAIRVDAYISKGAQNTWEKVLDGTLRAFSIGGKIIEKAEMTGKMHNGRAINLIKKYVLGELSLVDNPANAMAVVDIVKMDTTGELDYVLDIEEELAKAEKERLKDPKGGLTAAGRRHFKQTEGANLKPGVKGPANTPEKMRRKGSFLTRFFTNPSGPMKDEKGRPTRLALSAAAWGEPVPQDMADAAKLAAKGRRLLERYAKTKEKGIDKDENDLESIEFYMDFILEQNYDDLVLSISNEIDFSKKTPVPSNPELYARIKAEAKKKFKVYPSLYANQWLVREYKKRGGTYKIEKEGEVTTSSMGDSGIKNPTQGSFQTPTMPKPKKKKEKKMLNDEIKKAENESPTASALSDLLSNVVVMYFSAHRAHWNVQGPDFSEYHGLFEEIYSDVYNSIDPLAEMIRKLNSFPPELSDMVEDSTLEDSSMSSDARALAIDLYMKNSMLIGLLKSTFSIANSENEQGIANFIAERIDMHQKWDWQLRSSLTNSGFDIPEDPEDQQEDSMDSQDNSESSDMTEQEIADLLSTLLNRYIEVNVTKAAQTKRENGIDFPAAAFAYVPDASKPSTWKLRLWETLDSKETAAQVGRAVAAIGKGFMGNRASIPAEDMAGVKNKILRAWKKTHPDAKSGDVPQSIKKYAQDMIEFSSVELQKDNNYAMVYSMNNSDVESKVSLIKRLVSWLVPEENNSTQESETIDSVQNTEEEVDINLLKETLGAVVDEKLGAFSTLLKEEIQSSVNEQLSEIQKSFEVTNTELQEKLAATEKALSEQTEQVKIFAEAGAVKKSVDPEDDEEESLQKSAPKSNSVWKNTYLPQEVIRSLGYES